MRSVPSCSNLPVELRAHSKFQLEIWGFLQVGWLDSWKALSEHRAPQLSEWLSMDDAQWHSISKDIDAQHCRNGQHLQRQFDSSCSTF
eukprot:6482575-Amphidinium_carterae.1